MREQELPFHFTVTATTRAPRPGERQGIDYLFYTEEEFERLVAANGFLEHAGVYGHHYGVPKAPVLAALAQGRDVIMRTDVQGAATIRSQVPDAVLIFIAPPSEESLMARLRRRDTDSAADVALRLGKVQDEMATLRRFDYVVVNGEGELDRCVADVEAIARAEKRRVSRAGIGCTRDGSPATAAPARNQTRARPVGNPSSEDRA